MKTSAALTISLATITLAQLSVRAADDLPKPQAFARYDAMMNRSPFAVASAVVAPPQTPNFAKDLYIANAAKLADEGVVTLTSATDKNLKEYLSTKGPNKSGYSISNIEWSDRVGATKVTIAKDGQFATLTFNQALLAQPAANPPVQAQAQVPALPGVPAQNPVPGVVQPVTPGVPNYGNVNTIKPAPIPTLPTPPPRVRGVIQRNPNQSGADPVAQMQDQ